MPMQPTQEVIDGKTYTVHPSFVEQMAWYHYGKTDANASAVPWESLPPVKRDVLMKAMSDIVGKVMDTCDD